MTATFRENRAAIVALVMAVVIAVFVVLLASSDSGRTNSVNFEILGDVAPQIEGPTIAGSTYDLRAERGDWVVVNFFASWCAGCKIEHPELVKFSERHRDDNVQVVSVMFGDTEENALAFFEELGGDWPTLVEGVGSVAIDYGVTAVPETLLVSPSGRVVQKWVGTRGVTADQMDATINGFLAGPTDSDSADDEGGD